MPSKSFDKFQRRLVLAAYFRQLFGVEDPENSRSIRQYHESLHSTREGFAPGGTSYLAQRLRTMQTVQVPDGDLLRSDANIRRHTEALNARREEAITWKYFQHLAGLMAEHYLHRVKTDAEAFAADINAFAELQNKRRSYITYPTVSVEDLNKVAFWMATGSGKTLLMHLNYFQYLHYFGQEIDHILLVTPHEGLTRQHTAEMQRSGIDCAYYLNIREQSGELHPETVKTIEISKLVKEKTDEGVRVEVSAFEGRNLVFVDEGHKGTSSEAGTWRKMRRKLAEDGFTFEYSATFGQAVGGSTSTDIEEEYGRSILFNYAYQRFYDDGYGKDYRILNLESGADELFERSDELTERYLFANLLTFYEQQLVFERDEQRAREEYNLMSPLLMFVGHSVTGGRTVSDLGTADKRSVTDIQRLVAFLHRVLTDTEWAMTTLQQLVPADGGLQIDGQDLFADQFEVLRETDRDEEAMLADLRERIFHASGATGLALIDLQNAPGEIGLRAGDADRFFGVIDVGNERGFLRLTEQDLPAVHIDSSAFEGSLFKRINRTGSNINLLLGARKFIEGWSSWRVSTMGLMNIGRGEGPQIIQLFGRGVRLLGKDRTLKRSSAMPEAGPHPSGLQTLETLNIFGVRAKYMSQFRDYMEDEGIDTEQREIVRFKTRLDRRFVDKGLQVIRPDQKVTYSGEADLELGVDERIIPQVDLTAHVGIIESEDRTHDEPGTYTAERDRTIPENLIPLLNWDRIYRMCWRYREKEGYANLTFNLATLRSIIENEHYVLHCPEDWLECERFEELPEIESIVLRILRTYITEFYSSRKQSWERTSMHYEDLEPDDPNLVSCIEARVRESATQFLTDLLDRLERVDEDGDGVLFEGDDGLYENNLGAPPRVYFEKHLYMPLVTEEDDVAKYSPPGLNTGERTWIEHLRAFLGRPMGHEFMEPDRELYVLRNQARGQGVGFQMKEGGRFYPDFILWLIDGETQHIIFVDPKGLNIGTGDIDANPKVQFCQNINRYEDALNQSADRDDVRLHSFIVSTTSFGELRAKQTLDRREEFADRHIQFLADGPVTVKRMFDRVVEQAGSQTQDG